MFCIDFIPSLFSTGFRIFIKPLIYKRFILLATFLLQEIQQVRG